MNPIEALRPITRRAIPDFYASPGICHLPIPSGSGSGSSVASELDFFPVLQMSGPSSLHVSVSLLLAILAGTTITNTGGTVVNGDLGLSPGTSVTGFPPGIVNGTQHITDSEAAQAQLDLEAAYLDAEGRTGGTVIAGNIGGLTLTPGVYKSTSFLEISSGDLTLDGPGEFVFQIASTFIMTPGRQIILTGGAQASDIIWQVGSSATLGTTTVFKGTIMALTSITVDNSADVEGQLLARNGAVTLDTNSVTSGDGSVTLTWPEVAGAYSYVVYRATAEGGPFVSIAANVLVENFVDSGLVPGTYFYKVTAIEPNFGETTSSPVVAVLI